MYLIPLYPLWYDVDLLPPEGSIDEHLLQLLVGEVDDELLEPVVLEGLEPVDVEDTQHFVLLVGLHLEVFIEVISVICYCLDILLNVGFIL